MVAPRLSETNREPKPERRVCIGMSSDAVGYGHFLRGLFNDPRSVSAPTPSSTALSRAIAEEVDIAKPGLVVELGPGTGVVTRALVNRGLAQDRLITIECEASFVQLMRHQFPGVTVHFGNALEFESYLPIGAAVTAVVSGIPLLNFSQAARLSLIRKALGVGNNDRFIQLSYGWFAPVPPQRDIKMSRKTIWRNFPPAHIWTYDKV